MAEIVKIKMNNLLITHSPSIDTDNILSGDMEKYYFEKPANMGLNKNEMVIFEEDTNESLHFDLSKIEEISPISQNDSLLFQQKNVFALKYDGGQIITLYFD